MDNGCAIFTYGRAIQALISAVASGDVLSYIRVVLRVRGSIDMTAAFDSVATYVGSKPAIWKYRRTLTDQVEICTLSN